MEISHADARDLIENLESLANGSGSQEHISGIVTRVNDDGTVWVRMAGAKGDTPCVRTLVSVKPDDNVSVAINNGRATVDGNYTSPATDDTLAEKAMDAFSQLQIDTQGIRTLVSAQKTIYDGKLGKLEVSLKSEIEQTAERISTSVTKECKEYADNELDKLEINLNSKIDQTAESITATVTEEYKTYTDGKVKEVDDRVAKVEITANGITGTVTEAYTTYVDDKVKEVVQGPLSTVEQKADSISATVTSMQVQYGTCSTAAATQEKAVVASGFVLRKGAMITVKFTYANTASLPTLNVNSTGAKSIVVNNTYMGSAYYWGAQGVLTFVYDGSYWRVTDGATMSMIQQTANSISLSVTGTLGSTASIVMSVGNTQNTGTIDLSGVRNAFKNDTSNITITAGKVAFKSSVFEVYSNKTGISDDSKGIYIGNDGISVGSGNTYTTLANGHLAGGKAGSETGYIAFNSYWSDTGIYGSVLAGKGMICLLTNGSIGVGSYYGFDKASYVTIGKSGTVFFQALNNDGTYSLKGLDFKNGLMITEI